MDVGTTPQCKPEFRMLDESQIQRLHQAALRILDEVGVQVHHPEARELLAGHGGRIRKDNIVSIPGFLVAEALGSAPSNVVIYNRRQEPVMELGGRRIYFGTGTDLPKTVDLQSREIRDTLAEDVVAGSIISDALPNIDFIGSYGLPRDIPPGLHYLRCFQLTTANSVKPIFSTAESEDDLRIIWEMAKAVAGGERELEQHPFLIHYSEPVSPLTHSEEALAKLIFCARHRIPITYAPALLAGSTGPVTPAGALTVAVAEALSGLVIHQLSNRGAPIISGVAATIMDMRHATVSYTAPEFRLTHSAYADLFHHYGIPIWGTAGCSDAQFPDMQAGAEYGFTVLNAALDGANLIHDCGYLGQGFIAAPEMIVLANEVIAMVKRYMRGFEVREKDLALEVIAKVGPGGHFLGEKHTLEHFMDTQWQPEVFNRENLDNWMQKGKKTADQKSRERARRILENHKPEPLSESRRAELDRIWEEAQKERRREK